MHKGNTNLQEMGYCTNKIIIIIVNPEIRTVLIGYCILENISAIYAADMPR